MKILHLFRSITTDSKSSPLLTSQLHSLRDAGVEVEFYGISGKGFGVYFAESIRLRRYLRNHDFQIIHAHYALCGLTAILACGGKPIILSLMGSDILGEFYAPGKISIRSRIVKIIAWISQFFVCAIIAKSENIFQKIHRKNIVSIIPNGVNLGVFLPADKSCARKVLGLDDNKLYVLSLANPAHFWKNPGLTAKAVQLLNRPDVELITPYPVNHDKVATFLNAADAFISTSFMEGSSNVIKEAMACNCPVVATDVGDASVVLGDTVGCYLTGFQSEEITEKIGLALNFAKTHNRTNGRERIKQLGLDSETIAYKIIEVYKRVLATGFNHLFKKSIQS